MIKEEWAEKLKRICTEAGTYKPFFDEFINQLAQILEIRDNALAEFVQSGNKPVIVHTNKGGHANIVKNPALAVINECNQQALAYWRDLGLTPSGYRKLTGESIEEKKGGTLEAMLEKLEI